MATKVEDVLAKVQALGYATDTEAPQIRMVNSVHKRIVNARRWTFLLESTTKSTVANNGAIEFDTLATTQRIDAVRIEQGTSYKLLNPLDLSYLKDLQHTDRTVGTPANWAREGKNIRVWPIPDGIYTLAIAAVKNPSNLTAKTDELLIPDSHAVDICAYGVVMDLAIRERDWDAHNFARQLYAELYAELLVQYGMKQRQASGHVGSSGQWERYDLEDAWLPYGPS